MQFSSITEQFANHIVQENEHDQKYQELQKRIIHLNTEWEKASTPEEKILVNKQLNEFKKYNNAWLKEEKKLAQNYARILPLYLKEKNKHPDMT